MTWACMLEIRVGDNLSVDISSVASSTSLGSMSSSIRSFMSIAFYSTVIARTTLIHMKPIKRLQLVVHSVGLRLIQNWEAFLGRVTKTTRKPFRVLNSPWDSSGFRLTVIDSGSRLYNYVLGHISEIVGVKVYVEIKESRPFLTNFGE